MKTLEKEFVSGEGGFSATPLTYTQVARTDKVAIYARSRDGEVREYEVFRIKINPKGKKIFNTVLEDDEEQYPPTSAFGRSAWSFGGDSAKAKIRAMARYNELVKEAGAKIEEASEGEEEATMTVPVVKVDAGELKVPQGKFTHAELADFNQKTKQQVYFILQQYVKDGKLKIAGTRPGKGKASKLFEKA